MVSPTAIGTLKNTATPGPISRELSVDPTAARRDGRSSRRGVGLLLS